MRTRQLFLKPDENRNPDKLIVRSNENGIRKKKVKPPAKVNGQTHFRGRKGEGSGYPKKILIVDNSESILLLYSLELADEGYRVFTAKCDARILLEINQTSPDLIVLEQKPWDENWQDLFYHIHNTYRHIPIVLCSAVPGLGENSKPLLSEFTVVRSSDLSELKRKVKAALEMKLDCWKKILPREGQYLGRSIMVALMMIFITAL